MITQVSHPVLEVHDLTVSYEQHPVLWNVDLSLPAGKLIGILGPNGAGKSTLIKSIMGLITPTSGYVKIFDKALPEVRSRISYVPQRESVDWNFPASVLDVVVMGTYGKLGLFRRPGKKEIQVAQDALEQVGMTAFASRQIAELSGGQQQRVFIARALAQQADLYLMDEPFAAVDAATEQAIIAVLRRVVATGRSVIAVHHDLSTVPAYFDQVLLLNGRAVASGNVKSAFTPDAIARAYGGRLNVLEQAVAEGGLQ